MQHYIDRGISVVHIRHCSAGICQQEWVVAKWLGLSVTVRVGARARGWNPSFIFLFLSLSVNVTDIILLCLLHALSMSNVI